MWNRLKKAPSNEATPPEPPPTNNDSDSEDSIGDALESMDIDADFNCWSSFRDSIVQRDGVIGFPSLAELAEETDDEDDDPTSLTEEEKTYIEQWTRRVERDEVYESVYRPVPRETREVKDLATFLGLKPPEGWEERAQAQSSRAVRPKKVSPRRNTMGNIQEEPEEPTAPVSTPSVAETLLFPSPGTPKSILLKRGPVLLRQDATDTNVERELVLLSHGFVLAVPEPTPASSDPPPPPDADPSPDSPAGTSPKSPAKTPAKPPSKAKAALWRKVKVMVALTKFIRRTFDAAESAADVLSVDAVGADGFEIRLRERAATDGGDDDDGTTRRYGFTCNKPGQARAWVSALKHSHDAGGEREEGGGGAGGAGGAGGKGGASQECGDYAEEDGRGEECVGGECGGVSGEGGTVGEGGG